MASHLPEGTDSIIGENAVSDETAHMGTFGTGDAPMADETDAGPTPTGGPAATAGADAGPTGTPFEQAKAKLADGAAGLKGQAADKAREYAVIGKDRATETLHNVSRMIDDAAATVDEKVGSQYGDYARQAAEQVKGFAASIEGKDVDELIAQARDLVGKSPGIAIGAAATVGFVLARIVKAGIDPAAHGEQA